MPEKDTIVKRLIQEADDARQAADETRCNANRDRLNNTLKSWGLTWVAQYDELCVPGTEVVLTAPEASVGLRAAFTCPICHEAITRIIYEVSQLGDILAMEAGIVPLPVTHRCHNTAKSLAYAELVDPRDALKIIRYCEELREEVDRQTPGVKTEDSALYLLQLKLEITEIEAIVRAGFARGGD